MHRTVLPALLAVGIATQRLTDYRLAADVGRITLRERKRTEPEEALTIYLVPDSPRPSSGYADLAGPLRIVWGATELSTASRVKP